MVPRTVVLLVLVTVISSAGAVRAKERRPEFHGTISTLDGATRELMIGRSWRPGCPVPLRDLRLLRMTYWGFDRRAHRGRMVVHRWYAGEIMRVFHRLYDERFPIRSMVLVDRFGADDKRSMRADNTSGFNCRYRAGVCCRWSQHAYGRAIDIDPVENPYVWSGGYSPPNGRRFLDRSLHRRGMIHHHDAVWWPFHAVGWSWGGDWRSEKDYQHFSANGH